jgi:hypothetical protein
VDVVGAGHVGPPLPASVCVEIVALIVNSRQELL